MADCKRKSRGGVPARCAGFLLALCILLTPFSALAAPFSFTDSTYPINTDNLPDTSNLWVQAKQQNCNVFLFYKPSSGEFYFITCTDFTGLSTLNYSGPDYQFITIDNKYIASYIDEYMNVNGVTTHVRLGSNTAVFTVNVIGGTYSDWTPISISRYRFSVEDMYLIAFDMKSKIYDSQTNDETLWYFELLTAVYPYSYSNVIENPATQRLYFNNSGQLSNSSEPDSEPAVPEYSGILASIKHAIDNIQNWLSSLGTTIGGFFTDLWNNHLSQAFVDISDGILGLPGLIWDAIKLPFLDNVQNPPNGGLIWRMWQSIKAPFEAPDGALYNLPSKIWNAIKTPFLDDTEYPPNGGLLWRLWQSVKAPFIEGGVVYEFFADFLDDIKSLFVPSSTFLDTYKSNWDNLISTRFGALYQSVELTEDLFDDISVLFTDEYGDDFYITLPRLRVRVPAGLDRGVSERALDYSYYTIFEGGTYLMSDLLMNWEYTPDYGRPVDLYDYWEAFVYASLALLLFYQIKRTYMRVFANYTGGDDI